MECTNCMTPSPSIVMVSFSCETERASERRTTINSKRPSPQCLNDALGRDPCLLPVTASLSLKVVAPGRVAASLHALQLRRVEATKCLPLCIKNDLCTSESDVLAHDEMRKGLYKKELSSKDEMFRSPVQCRPCSYISLSHEVQWVVAAQKVQECSSRPAIRTHSNLKPGVKRAP